MHGVRRRAYCWLLCLLGAAVVPLRAEDALSVALRKLPQSVGADTTITMKPGERWVAVGIQEHVGYTHLARANPGGFGPGKHVYIPGRRLVIGLVKNGLVVNLPELTVYRWADGKAVDWYPISIGKITTRWHTPKGELHVIVRQKNPVWHRPDWAGGGTVPPGPRNPLGDRWIGLNKPGYGLHGTNDPASIGRTVSHGCIRLFPPHIHELFDKTWVGESVFITYQTVLIGQEHGIVYLAVFPDIYHHGSNSVSAARAQLTGYDLADVVPQGDLARILHAADGIAHPILGSQVAMRVDGHTISSPIGPTSRNGVYYVPLTPLAHAINADIAWDPNTQTATVRRAGWQAVIKAGQHSFLALGTLFVPIRPFIEALGGKVHATSKTLTVEMPAAIPGQRSGDAEKIRSRSRDYRDILVNHTEACR